MGDGRRPMSQFLNLVLETGNEPDATSINLQAEQDIVDANSPTVSQFSASPTKLPAVSSSASPSRQSMSTINTSYSKASASSTSSVASVPTISTSKSCSVDTKPSIIQSISSAISDAHPNNASQKHIPALSIRYIAEIGSPKTMIISSASSIIQQTSSTNTPPSFSANSNSHLLAKEPIRDPVTVTGPGSLSGSKRVFEAHKADEGPPSEVPAYKKVKFQSTQQQNGLYIGWYTGEPLIKVFAKERSDGFPHIIPIDRKVLPPGMHERWGQLVPRNKHITIKKVTLDRSIFPSNVEKLEKLRKETKVQLVKKLFLSRKRENIATEINESGQDEINSSNRQALTNGASQTKFRVVTTASKGEATGMHFSIPPCLIVGTYKDNPKVLIYARLHNKANMGGQRVLFSVSKDDSTNSGLEFPRRNVHEKIVFYDNFKKPTIEETKAVILSHLILNSEAARDKEQLQSKAQISSRPQNSHIDHIPESIANGNVVDSHSSKDVQNERIERATVRDKFLDSFENAKSSIEAAAVRYIEDLMLRDQDLKGRLSIVKERELELQEKEKLFREKEENITQREVLIKVREDALKHGVEITRRGVMRVTEVQQCFKQQINQSLKEGERHQFQYRLDDPIDRVRSATAKSLSSHLSEQPPELELNGLSLDSSYLRIPTGPNASLLLQKAGTEININGKRFRVNNYLAALPDLVVDGHLTGECVVDQIGSLSEYLKDGNSKMVQKVTPGCLVRCQGRYYVRRAVLKEIVETDDYKI